jgi:aspartate aminotransferase-like enzyme
MGNIGAGEVAKSLDAIEASLRALGVAVEAGAAVAAAAPFLPR